MRVFSKLYLCSFCLLSDKSITSSHFLKSSVLPTFKFRLVVFAALLQWCGILSAQDDFQLIGSGSQSNLGNDCFRLTQAVNGSYGAVWYRWQADLNQDFDLNANLNFGLNDFGADGIVFAFQNLCTNVGSTGGGMGIAGVNPSLFVEFDTYENPENGDLVADHIGIMSDGILFHTGPSSLSAPVCALPNCGNIENGIDYPVRIHWQAAIQTLDVYFNGTLRSSYTGNIIGTIFNGNPLVYWGFTSATGGFNNSHTVCINNFNNNQIQPSDTTWCANQPISFSVGNPVPNVTYQWQVSTDGGTTFTNISNSAIYSGVTTPTLVISNAPNNLIGNFYQVVITGCGGQTTSQPAEILPGQIVTITQQPINQDVCADTPVTLTVASPEATSYQWQEFINGNWVNLSDNIALGISGTQTPVLILSGQATSAGIRIYRCLLLADCSAETFSNQVSITHTAGPSIVNQTIDQTVCVGNDAGFSINASGPGLSYQWQMSTDGGVTFSNLVNNAQFSQVDTDFLTILGVTANLNNAIFQCQVSGTCGDPVTTNPSTLFAQSPPVYTQQPASVEACSGSTVQFSAAANGAATWQWEYSIDNGVSFQSVPGTSPYAGSNTPTLSINPVSVNMQGWVFRAVASGCAVDVLSAPATLNLLPELILEPIPSQITRCEGSSVQITIQAQNALSYQWEINSGSGFSPLPNTGAINGANTASLLVSDIPASWHLAQLRCKIVGECATLYSNILTFTVNGLPVLIAEPDPIPICSGSTMMLPIQYTGVGIQFHWEILDSSGEFVPLNQAGFTGVLSSNLSIETQSAMDGLILRCVLSGCDAEVKTDSIRLRILENEPVYLPNTFSPNEDQLNPEFRLFTAGNPQINASIYNRWGELIYSWTDANLGWDGKLNGAFVAEGMYVYKIRVETACEAKTYTGLIQVIR